MCCIDFSFHEPRTYQSALPIIGLVRGVEAAGSLSVVFSKGLSLSQYVFLLEMPYDLLVAFPMELHFCLSAQQLHAMTRRVRARCAVSGAL